MRLLMVVQTEKEYRLFLEAWEEFTRMVNVSSIPQETKSKIGTVQIKGIFYLENNPGQPSDIYTFQLLQSQHAKLNQNVEGMPRYVYDSVFVLGTIPKIEMVYFTRVLQGKLVGRVLMIDPTMTNSQKETARLYYPTITYGDYCQNPEYDMTGLVKDLIMFFFGTKGIEKFFPQPTRQIS